MRGRITAITGLAALFSMLLPGCPPPAPGDLCWNDGDGDGFGYVVPFVKSEGACGDTAGEVLNGDDCDDSSGDIYPGAEEIPDDWVDQDCDGFEDVQCRPDRDGDGYGGDPVEIVTTSQCDQAAGMHYLWELADCDDENPLIQPGADEIAEDGIDQDCDGVDSALCYFDGDHDGFGAGSGFASPDDTCDHDDMSAVPGDCDDSADWIHPDAEEIPNDGFDGDCDGAELVTCLLDADGDGWPGDQAVESDDASCSTEGLAPPWMPEDCDDADASIHPVASVTPDDGIDQDCSDGDSGGCYTDQDGDGYGAYFAVVSDGDCTGEGLSTQGGDCADLMPDIHPGATEICGDGIDQDCDGADAVSCFDDNDGDGFGSTPVIVETGSNCNDAGLSAWGGDCDDTTALVSPAAWDAPEDGIDQDCSGLDALYCYYDGDGDGYGWSAPWYDVDGNCTDPFQSPWQNDCNDLNFNVHPGAAEIPDDGVDQDCNGTDAVTCFEDADGDGYGFAVQAAADPDGSCTDDVGQAATNTDCNDGDATIHPDAYDTPEDFVDQDCNSVDAAWCWNDMDADGYGWGNALAEPDGDCWNSFLMADNDDDCADLNPAINPGATEVVGDAIDSDCDGDIDN